MTGPLTYKYLLKSVSSERLVWHSRAINRRIGELAAARPFVLLSVCPRGAQRGIAGRQARLLCADSIYDAFVSQYPPSRADSRDVPRPSECIVLTVTAARATAGRYMILRQSPPSSVSRSRDLAILQKTSVPV